MQIGEIVLFRIDQHQLRPLTVVQVHAPDPQGDPVVSGVVALAPEDRSSWWVLNRSKTTPTRETPCCWVASAVAGDEIGQYQLRIERRREPRRAE
jgi:hypothetical protein